MVYRKKRDIDEEFKVGKEVISELINIALASSKLKSITINQEKGKFDGRTNINIFLYGSIGSTKSTLLKEISEKTGCQEAFTDLTYPSLIGSIDKLTRQLLIGACWDCRNSLMLLDEFDLTKRKKDDIRSLLQLIEGGKYKKKLASFSSPTNETDEDLYYKFENGTFDIKTRFSLILATMKYPYKSQSQEVKAFVSRSIAIPLYPTKDDLKKVAKGYPIFNFKEIKLKKDRVEISKQDYEKIMDYVDSKATEINYLRILGDCFRVFAILGKHRFDLYDLIIKLGSKKFSTYHK